MSEILRFPSQAYCDDCGKPLDEDEGSTCVHPGCSRVGCIFCTQQSDRCLDHIGCDLHDRRH
jgi:hypothetical protein